MNNPDRVFLDEVGCVRISTAKNGDQYATVAYTSGAIIKKEVISQTLDEAATTHKAFVSYVCKTCKHIEDW